LILFSSKFNILSSIILETDDYANQRQSTLIGEMAVKVDAFNTLFDEKRCAAYATTDQPLDGIFTVC